MYNFFSDPVNAQLVNNCRNEFKPILKVNPAVISDVYVLTSCLFQLVHRLEHDFVSLDKQMQISVINPFSPWNDQ